MITIDLKRERWKGYFEAITHALEGKQALVEVAALSLGDHVAVDWVPLQGVTYDHKDDLLDLDLGDVNHIIRHPASIHIEADATELRSIEVIDAQNTRHIVRLREPLMLPAPSQEAIGPGRDALPLRRPKSGVSCREQGFHRDENFLPEPVKSFECSRKIGGQ